MRVASPVPVLALLAASLAALCAAPARADVVLSRRSRWNPSRTRIVSDLTVQRGDGRLETLLGVPGGTVDGIAMVQLDLFAAPPVAAFVRSLTKTTAGTALHWAGSCVYLTPDADGTTDVAGDAEFAVIDAAVTEWEDRTRSCGYLRFLRQPRDGGEVGYDGVNRVKFREQTWGRPAVGDDPAETYPPQAAALTTLFFIDRAGAANDGTILDADIELNAVNFAVGVGGQTTGAGELSDLSNTLTHELGHLVGLDHTCWDRPGTPIVDGAGNPVPYCAGGLPATVTEATMFNFQDAGETKKASLEQDDIDGFCATYPVAADPDSCQPVDPPGTDTGWCAATARSGRPGGAGGALAAAAAAALFLVVRRRRRA